MTSYCLLPSPFDYIFFVAEKGVLFLPKQVEITELDDSPEQYRTKRSLRKMTKAHPKAGIYFMFPFVFTKTRESLFWMDLCHFFFVDKRID